MKRQPSPPEPVPYALYPRLLAEASAAMSSLKLLVFAALMVAVTRALSMIPGIPIAHTKLTWGFLSRSLCARCVVR